jgi:uridine kinase
MKQLILIAGPAGAGKTTLAERISSSGMFGAAPILCTDWYFHRGLDDYDAPSTVDVSRLKDDVRALASGRDIDVAYRNHIEEGVANIAWTNTLIVEGLYTLTYEWLMQESGFRIYMSTHPYLAGARRVLRDIHTYGDPAEAALSRIQSHVVPAMLQFIEPQKSCADIEYAGDGDWPALVQKLLALKAGE